MVNVNEAIRNAYYSGQREGHEKGRKEIINDLKDIVVDYNYSQEVFEKVLSYLREKGADL